MKIGQLKTVSVFGKITAQNFITLECDVAGSQVHRLSDKENNNDFKVGTNLLLTYKIISENKRALTKIQEIKNDVAFLIEPISDLSGEPSSEWTTDIKKMLDFIFETTPRLTELFDGNTVYLQNLASFFNSDESNPHVLVGKKLAIFAGKPNRMIEFINTFKHEVDSFLKLETNVITPSSPSSFDELFLSRRDVLDFSVSEPVQEEDKSKFNGWIDGHYIPENMRPLFALAEAFKNTGEKLQALVVGPSGYGKTATFEVLAKQMNYRFVRVNCATTLDTESWFGYHEARGGETVFLPTEFSKALIDGNCVIVLDEANRIEPWLSNSLLPILDHAGQTVVHGETIKVGPNVIIGLTMNRGIEYVGTFNEDQALLNRIHMTFIVEPPSPDVESLILHKKYSSVTKSICNKIVKVMNQLRNVAISEDVRIDISTRVGLNIARIISIAGESVSIRNIFEFSLLNNIPLENRKSFVDVINTAFGTLESL